MKEQQKFTRRQLIKGLGAGSLAAAVGVVLPKGGTEFLVEQERQAEAYRTFPKVEPFALSDVQLLDSPFLKAQERDARYLLQLEPDRLLHNFRVNAGLKPKAPVYGGWESVEPWVEIKCHGHTLGHYLSACSMMFASTNEQQFKQRVDYIVAELNECQTVSKTGLVCAFPDGSAPLDQILNATRFVGVPWYTMHKIFAGLRDAYLYTRNRIALDVLVKLSDWTLDHTKALSADQFQKMLSTEHGGMNEVLADVYSLTGQRKYLELAKKFCHRALLDPLTQEHDTLDRLHSNTQIPKVIGFNRLYELTGDENYAKATRFFWGTVVNNRSFVTGGNGDGEHFFPVTDFPLHLQSAKTMETCCTHNMLKLTRGLFRHEPSAAYFNYYERALYNSILASQDPDSGMMTYFQSTRPGYLKLYCTPFDSFWCCTGSGMENHAKYRDSIYFHDATALFVNLFVPSAVHWQEKGVTITQTTNFPDQDHTTLRFTLRKPVKMALKIRHPAWCGEVVVDVNGRRFSNSTQPARYFSLDRTWRNGDTVEIKLPMALRAEALPGTSNIVALLYGPIVLAGKLGTKGIKAGSDIIINERTVGDVLKDVVTVSSFTGTVEKVLQNVKRTSAASLTFRTEGIGNPFDVDFIPYFRIAHERYGLYWRVEG